MGLGCENEKYPFNNISGIIKMLNNSNSHLKSILLMLLLVIPKVSFASDMSGLFYILGLQVVLMFWPLIIPLFFLKNDTHKVKSYIYKVVIIYGILGLVTMPQNMYFTLGIWFGVGDSIDYDYASAAQFRSMLIYLAHLFVFIASILLFKFYSFNLPNKKTLQINKD